MSVDAVRQIADAVLYEGYLLYPYRASAQKNRSRWQFGVVMPVAYAERDPSERSAIQVECVLERRDGAEVEVTVRFLGVQRRTVERWDGTAFVPARELDVDGAPVPAWDESVEHEVRLAVDPERGGRRDFEIPGGTGTEEVRTRDGRLAGRLRRHREPLSGTVSARAEPLPGPWGAVRFRVRVENLGPLPVGDGVPADTGAALRQAALPGAFLACHLILSAPGGAFVSMVDPPRWAREAVDGCVNTGVWPVLAGPPGDHHLVLAAPIILYDHPELAPESPGDLFDGTEIDEILTLRTLALSDDEKREVRATDTRAAALLDRTESLDAAAMARLHGTIRALRPVGSVAPTPAAPVADAPWWDPGADASVSPSTDTVDVNGVRLARGSRVTLRPGIRRADAHDMFLAGRAALVEAVLSDVDGNTYLAVTLADDPDSDIMRGHGRFLYFAPDEVEPA